MDELVPEFSTSEKPATIIAGLINNKLPKPKLDELLAQYHRLANCNSLLAPKTNKIIWGQLKDSTRKTDIGMQKCQTLFLTAAHALLQASKTTIGETSIALIHAMVLILSGHKKFNLKRRELLKPDLSELKTSYSSKIQTIIGTSKPFEAGQLQNCLAEWKSITSDPFILQCITNCELVFNVFQIPQTACVVYIRNKKFSLQEQHAIDGEIRKFLDKQIIQLSETDTGQIISPISLRPKTESGTFRIIFKLKHLNPSVTYRKFKIATFESAIKLMKPGWFYDMCTFTRCLLFHPYVIFI